MWVGGPQRTLQVGSGGPDGALGRERPAGGCVPPSPLGLGADGRAGAGPALHTPTPFCTRVHSQARQGPHVCSHAAQAKISTRTFFQNLDVRTKTGEAMWPPHPRPGAGPGEPRREEHSPLGWGWGWGVASVAVEPAGCLWARLGLQSPGEGQRAGCAQQPAPAPPPRPSAPLMGAQTPTPAQAQSRIGLLWGGDLSVCQVRLLPLHGWVFPPPSWWLGNCRCPSAQSLEAHLGSSPRTPPGMGWTLLLTERHLSALGALLRLTTSVPTS